MKFKILGGKHASSKGVNQVGDVVESPEQLDELFKNKFQQVEDGAKVTKAVPGTEITPPMARPDAEQLAAQKAKDKAKQAEQDADSNDDSEEEEGSDGDAIQEVTKQFTTAHKAGVTVGKKGSSYYVYDEKSSNPEAPLNVKPLKKAEVASFIKEL